MNISGLCNIVILSGIQIPMFKFIKPLLDNSPDCKVDLMVPDKINGNLKVDNVTYYYPNQDTAAIQQANLFIKQGTFVVVAGGSGSGKSTLGKLLSGLDHPSSGHVFIDDYELHTLDPSALRKNIAVVPQDFRLINGSLFENIKGAFDASLDEVIVAARASCIWDDISELPMKLHTVTGTQFGAFSGGQIQRIAIARALIRKPRVLIMDEATSALDNELQAQIIKNVKSMNCTVVFIAHRLKIAKEADQIIVLDNGQCVERGTHDELLGYNKFYAKMWSALS
jgi:ATP-binding cassette subfamily C protein